MSIKLKTMTWNHPRAILPMKATFAEFQKRYPHVDMEWATRSLKDFEDYPIEELAEEYDFILLDHPCMGRAYEHRSLVAMSDLLPEEFLEELSENSVGPGFESYRWQDKIWALPIDAAAQVSAYRADLLEKHSQTVPVSWGDVVALGKQLPEGIYLGFPLNAAHSFLSFMSICANISNGDLWDEHGSFKEDVAKKAFDTLKQVFSYCHPLSLTSDPIAILEAMGETNEIAYVPLTYGYVNYSFAGFKQHLVHFTDIPSYHEEPVGSIIGGVGLGISAKCEHLEIAKEFAMYAVSGDCQKGLYFDSDGQPAHRKAWTDASVNERSQQFFANTLRTLDLSYVRPRSDGYTLIQEPAGVFIQRYLKDELTKQEALQAVNELVRPLSKE